MTTNIDKFLLTSAAILLLGSASGFVAEASAAALPCSIHPTAGIADADLPALAKVTMAAAERTALKTVNVPAAKVASSELESEGGCLIYTFDIKVPGKASVVEVAIDAGTGKLLSKKSEGPRAQAAEAAADLAAAKMK